MKLTGKETGKFSLVHETDPTVINAKGGTELMRVALFKHVDNSLLNNFQIICSRVRSLNPDKKRILWLHDTWDDPESKHLSDPELRKRFDKIVFVSYSQFESYQLKHGITYDESAVLRNAIEPIPFVEKPTDVCNLIYHTTPHRGLELLVPVYEKLYEKYGNKVHLHVFSSFSIYGWPKRDEPYKPIIEKCKTHPGISYYGAVSNDEIREALQTAHIFAYPSIWPETSCQIAGTKILTNNGVKSIENIKVGDEVMTHFGLFKKVTEIFSRPYSGKLYGIKSVGNFRPSYFTPEHMLYVGDIHKRNDSLSDKSYTGKIYREKWIRIDSIDKNNHCTLRPKLVYGSLSEINLIDYLDKSMYEVVNGNVVHKNISRGNYKTVVNTQKLTKEFAWMLGLFAGDGNVSARNNIANTAFSCVCFSHHSNEQNNANKILEFFGEDVKIKIISENEIRTNYHNSIWARFLRNVIGISKNKKIPSFIWKASKEVQQAFVDGYFAADGNIKKGEGSDRKRIDTISEHLAYGLCQMLTGLGYFSSITYNNERCAFTVSWREMPEKKHYLENEKYIGTKIDDITTIDFVGTVYNFEVEDAHSYVTDNIIAHNCIAAIEALSASCVVVCPNFGALPETTSNFAVMYPWSTDPNIHANRFYGSLCQAIDNYFLPTTQNMIRFQKTYIDSFYDWKIRAKQWEIMLKGLLKK